MKFSIVLVVFTCLVSFSPISLEEPIPSREITTKPAPPNISERMVRSSHRGNVRIYSMKNEGTDFGHSIWMSRKKGSIQAKYFAFREQNRLGTQTVYNRYVDWKRNKNIVAVCSGAFSTELPGRNNRNAVTVGLTVDNGRIVNRNIEHSMDGLVIVYATGGIVVSDIENKNLKIGNKYISVIDDKLELLDWAVSENATIFQTQLLVYNNTLRISRAGRTNERERRFLALVNSRKEGLFHVIFDVPYNTYLFNAAKDLFYYLRDDKGMEVVALLNLDTGAYNVMELYQDGGQKDREITGITDIKVSTNLIVYHQAN